MAAKKNGKAGRGARNGKVDPNKTILIVSDDGKVYQVTNLDWHELTDSAATGVVQAMTTFGSYLSFFPSGTKQVASGFGELCTVVNLKAILQNNTPPKK
jgi:hypothetical protein